MTTKTAAVRQAEEALQTARANAQRDKQLDGQRSDRDRELASVARAEVRRYRAEVDAAVKAAVGVSAGPPAGAHARQYARALLHRFEFRGAGSGQQDALLEALWMLHDRGLWLNDYLPNLDAHGRLELDLAESEAWRHLIQRARQVAGE